MSEQRRFIGNLDEAWRSYVHNQNAEIGYLRELQRRANRLVVALEDDHGIAEAIAQVKESSQSCANYHAWREKHDEQR